MTILRPRKQEILPKWNLSVVLKGLMKPPFTIRGSDKNISLELLSYKTAFLVALATGARGSELVALSRASHNLEFSTLASGAEHASIRMVPKFIPKDQRPQIIPEQMKFPGIAHLFHNEPERLLCPVRVLSLYIVRSAERAQDDSQEKLCAFQPYYSNVHHTFSSLGCWDHLPDIWKFFWVWSTENQGPWRQGNLHINRFLPECSPERIMRIDWLEIVQRIRPPLSSRHGSRYGTPGHPSGGHKDGFPVIWCPNYSSLATSTNVG